MSIAMKAIALTLLATVLGSFWVTPSFALPAFARKYDLSCTSCHTKPPRLNSFGEAFHMAGFQIPMVSEGEIRGKRRIGRVFSETNLLDISAIAVSGDLVRNFSNVTTSTTPNDRRGESSFAFPQNIGLYLAGTLTDAFSYFFEFEYERQDDSGASEFGLGKEAFVMIDLPTLWGSGGHAMASHGASPAVHGPMLMAGKIDPSTNFSYPTNRQIIEKVPGSVGPSQTVERFALTPYAFASKFFGVMTSDGKPLDVVQPVLYNTTGSPGIDLHAMVGDAIIQGGVMEGSNANASSENNQKDFYLMGRINFGGDSYLSGSLSGFGYFGNDTARVPITQTESSAVDWRRVGVGWNLKWRFLDLYGAYVEDTIQNLPASVAGGFDNKASGLTLAGDYLATDRLLLSVRFDRLDAGGRIAEKADGTVWTLQSRYYLRDNLSFYLRDSVNAKSVSPNPIRNFKNLVTAGLNFDF